MAFLNPSLLWGMLAISLPILIHFWYQKKGKTIAWAASQWLTEKTSLKHRGIRIDEIPLLIIRCLLVILLSLLLSKPLINLLAKNEVGEKIHLVQGNAKVMDNFRFELETAFAKKEKVFLIGEKQEALKDLSSISSKSNDILLFQQNINQLAKRPVELHVYLINDQIISRLPKIYIPGHYHIHSFIDSVSSFQKPFAGLPERSGSEKLNVLVNYNNTDEQQTVQAALLALTDVYDIAFNIDKQPVSNKHYNLVFTDQQPATNNSKTLYFLSKNQTNVAANVIEVQDSLRLATSDVVRNGQLPEWIGEKIMHHFDLAPGEIPLSNRQLMAHFESVKSDSHEDSETSRQWILLLFVSLLILERWVALRDNLRATHA